MHHVEVPVAFHVIRDNSGGGNSATVTRIQNQIEILNQAYQSFNISFFVHSIHYTNNSTWFSVNAGSPTESQMKSALAVHPNEIFNVYITNPASGLLGWAYFPDTYPENSFMHGAVITHTSLPSGQAPFHLGHTLTHEAGHYLGLFHTFEGGCSDWDMVSDTPAHQVNTGKPSPSTDSCPYQPGFDPVHNFMNYVDDDWMWEFTGGQLERATAITEALRPTLVQKSYIWSKYSWDQNWRNTGWFGWIYDGDYPWLYHMKHGWIWSDSQSEQDIWVYDASPLGWWHTKSSSYPDIYSIEIGAWLRYIEGTNPRLFWNYTTESYLSIAPGARY